MAIADVSTKMQGLGTNPSLTLTAADFGSKSTELISGTEYLGGKAVRGTYPGQVLMETGWFKSGTLNNIIMPTAYIHSGNESTPCVSYHDHIIVTVYKRPARETLNETNISGFTSYASGDTVSVGIQIEEPDLPVETQEFTIHYIDGISNTIGAIPNAQQVNRPATNFLWFDVRYEYKFSIRVGRLTPDAYIDLSGIYLQYHNSTAIMGARQFQWTGLSTEAVPLIDGMGWGVTANASGNFTAVLGSEVFDGVGGIGGTSGIQSGLFNSIEAVVTTLASASVYDNNYELKSYPQVSTTNGGFEVVVVGTNFGANSVLTFYTIIFGHQTAQEM